MQDDSVIWEFDSSEYPQFKEGNYKETEGQINGYDDEIDYMHFNSFAIDPSDGNLVDQILIFDGRRMQILFPTLNINR